MKEPNLPGADRVSTKPNVTLRLPSGGKVEGALHEVSLNGLHLHLEDPPEGHGPCHVGLILDTDKGALEVHCAGSIISRHDGGVVVHVESVAGVESLDHLRGLVHDTPASKMASGKKSK